MHSLFWHCKCRCACLHWRRRTWIRQRCASCWNTPSKQALAHHWAVTTRIMWPILCVFLPQHGAASHRGMWNLGDSRSANLSGRLAQVTVWMGAQRSLKKAWANSALIMQMQSVPHAATGERPIFWPRQACFPLDIKWFKTRQLKLRDTTGQLGWRDRTPEGSLHHADLLRVTMRMKGANPLQSNPVAQAVTVVVATAQPCMWVQ